MAQWSSAIDEQLGVPGDDRRQLALACAETTIGAAPCDWGIGPWLDIDALDESAGFGTRRAARVLARRPSDGRWLFFRYPFRDGSRRWIIPGGGAEAGESPLDAVRREVVEETGVAPTGLAPTGLLLYHVLASSLRAGRTPMLQYSPVYVGEIVDELPDTGGRDAVWLSADEFDAHPHKPLHAPVLQVLRAAEAGEPAGLGVWTPIEAWLPA